MFGSSPLPQPISDQQQQETSLRKGPRRMSIVFPLVFGGSSSKPNTRETRRTVSCAVYKFDTAKEVYAKPNKERSSASWSIPQPSSSALSWSAHMQGEPSSESWTHPEPSGDFFFSPATTVAMYPVPVDPAAKDDGSVAPPETVDDEEYEDDEEEVDTAKLGGSSSNSSSRRMSLVGATFAAAKRRCSFVCAAP